MEANVNIGGTKYLLQSDDDYLTHVGPIFEPDMAALFQTLAQGTVLDIGANIGCTALLFSKLADSVHAFEPSPSTYRLLQRNTSCVDNVVTHNIGLGEIPEESELTFAANNRSGGFVSDKTKASLGHTVEKIVIDTLDHTASELALKHINFIKIDVEGFEAHVIRGGIGTLALHRPTVILEMNHWCLNAFQRTSIPDFLDYLRSVFPYLYAIQGNKFMNLYDTSESYIVMYHHILNMKYNNLVGAFHMDQLELFHRRFIHGA